jgi:hypothetical protein
MLRSDKKLAELGKVLNHGNHNEIKARISMLRSEEPFEGALKLLAQFYDTTDDEELKLIISRFFNDMKESSGRAEVIESISTAGKPSTKAMLASSCWQSGQDYSDHAVALTEAFILGDYMTSLECFTVLENCAGMVSSDDKSCIISRIGEEITGWNPEKQQLGKELISIMRF